MSMEEAIGCTLEPIPKASPPLPPGNWAMPAASPASLQAIHRYLSPQT